MTSFFNPSFQYKSFVQSEVNAEVLRHLRSILSQHFVHSTSHYEQLDDERFRLLVSGCQEKINEEKMHIRFCRSHSSFIERMLKGPFQIQSNCYLRATRPIEGRVQESIGFHREIFYGPEIMKYAFNLWVPIQNVVPKNSMFYVPLSHHLPDSKIKTASISTLDSSVKRFSSGHKIGLLYSPKQIVEGVDFSKKRRLVTKKDHFALFPGDLIHGSAQNKSNHIRFSMDFRIVAETYLEKFTSKKNHFSSNSPYFIPII